MTFRTWDGRCDLHGTVPRLGHQKSARPRKESISRTIPRCRTMKGRAKISEDDRDRERGEDRPWFPNARAVTNSSVEDRSYQRLQAAHKKTWAEPGGPGWACSTAREIGEPRSSPRSDGSPRSGVGFRPRRAGQGYTRTFEKGIQKERNRLWEIKNRGGPI